MPSGCTASRPRNRRSSPVADPLGGWRVSVDRELCMGTGMCIVYAPGTFAHDAEATAIIQERPSDPLTAVRDAVEACPMAALALDPPEVSG